MSELVKLLRDTEWGAAPVIGDVCREAAAEIERLTENRNAWIAEAKRLEDKIERLERELADALSLVSSYKPYQAERDRLERERDKWCNDAHSEAAANQGLRAALEQLRQARLTWGMACSHQCEACDEFWEAFRTAPGPGVLPNEAPPAKDEVLEAVRAGRVTYPPEVLPTGRWMPAEETMAVKKRCASINPDMGMGRCEKEAGHDRVHQCGLIQWVDVR